ncbi:protein SRC2 homolog [Magnolia sinica]|uniref:protein SRC2 homolog n=1 Tax=Magnolia sinica TaxID=86752 RepID=UPI002659E98F|nr:protein SRC2 homolog [Magnolia sinica]
MHLLSPYSNSYPSSSDSSPSMSTFSGIQGHLLEVTVVGCNKLLDTEWISKQDPYVCLEYANTKFRTRTCTDGHKNPTFQEKFVFSLIEGLRELNVVVWNSNTLTYDDFIGSGRIQLQKVLSQGFDDTAWPLQNKKGRHAGEVRLILHYANASNKPSQGFAPSMTPYGAPAAPYVPPYTTPAAPHASPYTTPAAPHASPYTAFPHAPATTYPAPSPYSSYPPPPANPNAYPPSVYPPPPQATAYNTQTYPSAPYPPPPQTTTHYPQGPYPGIYPPAY